MPMSAADPRIFHDSDLTGSTTTGYLNVDIGCILAEMVWKMEGILLADQVPSSETLCRTLVRISTDPEEGEIGRSVTEEKKSAGSLRTPPLPCWVILELFLAPPDRHCAKQARAKKHERGRFGDGRGWGSFVVVDHFEVCLGKVLDDQDSGSSIADER